MEHLDITIGKLDNIIYEQKLLLKEKEWQISYLRVENDYLKREIERMKKENSGLE